MQNEEVEIIEDEVAVVPVEGSAMQLLREKATIDIQVATAHAFPRNVESALKNMLFTATMDIETAEKCTYAVPRAGKAITGKSIGLAKICLQAWGNLRGEARVTNVADRYLESEAVVWDLEANVAIKVTVKRSIMQNKGKDRMSDDMIVVTGNACNSIALRNAVFNVIPQAITDKVYSSVQAKIIGDTETYARRLKKVVEGFKTQYGKTEKEILALVGKTEMKQIKPEDLVVLIGVATALKDGDTQVDSIFKPTPKTKEELQKEVTDKKEALKKSQQPAAAEVPAEQIAPAPAAETKKEEKPEITAEIKTGAGFFEAGKMP